jgi:lipid A 3-O-deacylase
MIWLDSPELEGRPLCRPNDNRTRQSASLHCKESFRPYRSRGMRTWGAAVAISMMLLSAWVFAEGQNTNSSREDLNPPRFEVAAQTGYLLGVFGNPDSYEIGPEFLAGRVRWGVNDSDSWLRGYNQFCLTALFEPIFRGIENQYFGVNFGGRYNFVRPNNRFSPYFSGGLGLGWIDSHPDMRGSQGQNFTFNILTAAGLFYKIDDHWKVDVGVLYQHLSNGGQTDPNPSLNLFGPQIGLTYSF